MDYATRQFLRFLLCIPIGMVGGWFCGSIILSFGSLIGVMNSDTVVGSWEPAILGLALIYGAPVGVLMMLIAYATHLHKTGFRASIIPATLGTIGGGLIGALAAPPLAVITGCAGFFLALQYVLVKQRKATGEDKSRA